MCRYLFFFKFLRVRVRRKKLSEHSYHIFLTHLPKHDTPLSPTHIHTSAHAHTHSHTHAHAPIFTGALLTSYFTFSATVNNGTTANQVHHTSAHAPYTHSPSHIPLLFPDPEVGHSIDNYPLCVVSCRCTSHTNTQTHHMGRFLRKRGKAYSHTHSHKHAYTVLAERGTSIFDVLLGRCDSYLEHHNQHKFLLHSGHATSHSRYVPVDIYLSLYLFTIHSILNRLLFCASMCSFRFNTRVDA